MNKCFFIFHDWRESECWANEYIDYDTVSLVGYECRRCGRREIKRKGVYCPLPLPHSQALTWLKEEVIK